MPPQLLDFVQRLHCHAFQMLTNHRYFTPLTYFKCNWTVQVVNNGTMGFTNSKQACYVIAPNLAENSIPSAQPIGAPNGSLCSDPDSHVFWDQ